MYLAVQERSRAECIFSAQQSLQRSEGMFRKRSFHDDYTQM
jgi:hypothetical protein